MEPGEKICTGAGDCMASPHLHGCYADRGDCDRPREHGLVGERIRRAEKALSEELPAGNPLWMPWALELADDVMALAQRLQEAGKAWEDFNQQELDRILLAEQRVDDE